MQSGDYDIYAAHKKQLAKLDLQKKIRSFIQKYQKDNHYPFIHRIENFSDEEVTQEFFTELHQKYKYQLQQISKGYSLSLIGCNAKDQIPILTAIKSLSLFLSNNKDPIFHFMNIDLSGCEMDSELLNQLCHLIQMVDNISLNMLE